MYSDRGLHLANEITTSTTKMLYKLLYYQIIEGQVLHQKFED